MPGPEVELLVCCARTDPEPYRGRIEALLRRRLDWTRLVRTALAHGTSPLLAKSLERMPSDAVPEDIRQALRAHLADNAKRNQVLLAALFDVLDGLAARDVEAIPFKGPVLGAVAYGDALVRRAGDLDILVREEQVGAAFQHLLAAGYRELTEYQSGRPFSAAEDSAYRRYQCEYAFVREADAVIVEPHWALAPKTLAVPLDYAGLWSRARIVAVSGRQVPSLALDDLVLGLCVHASKHEWSRLRWICDVAELVERQPGLDWDAALGRAREQGSERMLLLGLGLAGQVRWTELAPPVRRRLDEDREAQALVNEVAARLFHEGWKERSLWRVSSLRVRMRERPGDRVRYVLRTIVTPTERHIRMIDLPAWLYPAYVPLKLTHDYVALPMWHMATRVVSLGRALWRAVSPVGRGRRLLIVDWLPHVREGAGFPRMNALVRLLAGAGYRVTLHPVQPCFESDAELFSDLPRALEVIRGRGLEGIEGFLQDRGSEFDAVVVCRPLIMPSMTSIFDRRPDLRSRARLIYDAEAIFAAREILRRRLLGEPMRDTSAARLVADEVALARQADVVIVVSRQEQEVFERCGARNVRLLPLAMRPAPTPRGFAERRDLLFVGRLAEDGWPNTDALVWFLDHVFPEVRGRLAAMGQSVALRVAGMTGARALAARPQRDVHFLGVVADLTPLYDAARVFIAPTRFSAGVPHKIVEAAARGVPVVATRLLADQLGWRPEEDLLASEVSDAGAFADNVVAAYTRGDLWARLRASALARIERECAPELVLSILESVLGTAGSRA